jgi:hypothetical protein
MENTDVSDKLIFITPLKNNLEENKKNIINNKKQKNSKPNTARSFLEAGEYNNYCNKEVISKNDVLYPNKLANE